MFARKYNVSIRTSSTPSTHLYTCTICRAPPPPPLPRRLTVHTCIQREFALVLCTGRWSNGMGRIDERMNRMMFSLSVSLLSHVFPFLSLYFFFFPHIQLRFYSFFSTFLSSTRTCIFMRFLIPPRPRQNTQDSLAATNTSK